MNLSSKTRKYLKFSIENIIIMVIIEIVNKKTFCVREIFRIWKQGVEKLLARVFSQYLHCENNYISTTGAFDPEILSSDTFM